MLSRALAVVVAGALCLAGGVAQAQVQPRTYANRPFPPSTSTRADLDASIHIQKRLKDLRKEAVALQKADGGKLTEQHHAELTAKLESIRRDACISGLAGC